jgi:hypothetical protein
MKFVRYNYSKVLQSGGGKIEILINLLFSIILLTIMISPFYEIFDIYGKVFIVACGALFIFIDKRFNDQLPLVIFFIAYIFLIIIFNGFNSLRLGALTAVFFGLIASNAKIISGLIPVYLSVLVYVLFDITDGFDRVLIVGGVVSEGASINYFGQQLFLILILIILAEKNYFSRHLAFIVCVVALLFVQFVPSRQLLIVGGCASIYIILNGRHIFKKICMFIIIFFIGFYFLEFEENLLYGRLTNEGGSAPGRLMAAQCYLSKYSITDLIVGSDQTEAGNCGILILGMKYLHNGYLEVLTELGFLGFLMVVSYPLMIIYFVFTKNSKYVFILCFAGIYQFAEGGFMWLYFLFIFVLCKNLFKINKKRFENIYY